MENIEQLKTKFLLFNDFLIKRLKFSDNFFNNELLNKAVQEKNIKVLKSGNIEINLLVKEMSLEMQLELKDLFKDKLDLDLDIFQKLFDKNIEKIIKRGKISNDDEYRLLLDRMDNLTEVKTKEDIKKINNLLIDYSNK